MNKALTIIGSVLGTIVGIVGLVAAFFPDAINLQKNKINSFAVEIDARTDVDALWEFLDAHKEQIVQLDISICRDREERKRTPRIKMTDTYLTIYHDGCDPDISMLCTGDHFYFAPTNHSKSDYENNVWDWYKHEGCKNSDVDGLFRISGYFLVPTGTGFAQGNLEWVLKPIPPETITLKRY